MKPAADGFAQEETFRHAVPILLAAYTVEVAGSWFFRWFAEYPLVLEQIVAATIVELVGLAVCFRWGVSSRRYAIGHLLWVAACQGVILHAMGDLRVVVAPAVWTFFLVIPGVRLTRRAHYFLGNAFVVLYLAIVGTAYADPIPRVVSPDVHVTPAMALKLTVVMFLVLNVAALIVSEVKRAFETRDAELEERVQARTRESEEANRALRQKQEELRMFSYIVSHDLLSPIGCILMGADRWREEERATFTPMGARRFDDIVRNASHAQSMLGNLLILFKVTSDVERSEWVDLEQLVAEACLRLESHIQDKGVQMVVGSLPVVWGQPKKLGHVVFNLISNALKYVSAGQGRVEVAGSVARESAVFFVKDNGIGIAPQYHGRILRLYGRVPVHEQLVDGEAVPGTGVGLALVKRIVEMHGGTITVDSRHGEGATFIVTLPVLEWQMRLRDTRAVDQAVGVA